MAKYKLVKACYFNDRLYKAGEVVDFGDQPAPKGSVEVPTPMLEKVKAAAAKATAPADAEQEDALLKGKK